MLELTGSPSLPTAPWGPSSSSPPLTSRAPLASDFNNTTSNRRSTTGSSSSARGGGGVDASSEYNESEWGENQSAFGDVPLGLLSRRSSAVSDVNDLSELDNGSVHVDKSLPLDTLVKN
jgi:hypothetical protein